MEASRLGPWTGSKVEYKALDRPSNEKARLTLTLFQTSFVQQPLHSLRLLAILSTDQSFYQHFHIQDEVLHSRSCPCWWRRCPHHRYVLLDKLSEEHLLTLASVWNVLVNGKDQGVGNKAGGYIDSPPNNNPVLDVTSKSIECNVASVKASKSINVAGGDEITFEWHHDTNDAGDDIIASVCLS
jgi:hypothetical protein